MINFNDTIYTREELKELETASKNLPSEVSVIAYTDNKELNKEYSFFIVGRDENDLVMDRDVIFLSNEINTEYVTRMNDIDYYSKDYMDSFCLKLEKVPEYIQFIDIFMMKKDFYFKFKKCRIRFLLEEEQKDLFTYVYEGTNDKPHLFVGSFARVSDGWKFYPKFREHGGAERTILSKYKGCNIL